MKIYKIGGSQMTCLSMCKLSFNEILIICPNCKTKLIKEIELRATKYNQLTSSRDRCPNCYNFI